MPYAFYHTLASIRLADTLMNLASIRKITRADSVEMRPVTRNALTSIASHGPFND